MGSFRPARRVAGPHGQAWEIYVTRTKAPAWSPIGYSSPGEDLVGSGMGMGANPVLAETALVSMLFMIPQFILFDVIWPVVRYLLVLPFAFVRGRRTEAVWIEAINFYPHRAALLWTSTRTQLRGVVEQIAVGLAVGRVEQPIGAVYCGAHEG